MPADIAPGNNEIVFYHGKSLSVFQTPGFVITAVSQGDRGCFIIRIPVSPDLRLLLTSYDYSVLNDFTGLATAAFMAW